MAFLHADIFEDARGAADLQAVWIDRKQSVYMHSLVLASSCPGLHAELVAL